MSKVEIAAVIGTVEAQMHAISHALEELLTENPDVAALSGDSLGNLVATNDSLSLTGDFLKKWGGARSMNGAIIELEILVRALETLNELKSTKKG